MASLAKEGLGVVSYLARSGINASRSPTWSHEKGGSRIMLQPITAKRQFAEFELAPSCEARPQAALSNLLLSGSLH